MGAFDFQDIGLLIDEMKRPDGSYFFERDRSNKDGQQKSAFQKQHIHPQDDMTILGRDFYDRISSSKVTQYRFNGADFELNGLALPVSDADAVRIGMSAHRGSHPAYTTVVRRYRVDVTNRAQRVETAKFNELMGMLPEAEALADARKFANNFMAREWQGVLRTLRMATQVDGIPEAGTGRRPGLVMHDGDPFRINSSFNSAQAYNADFYVNNPIDKIAGHLNLELNHIGETVGGIESFKIGIENRVLPYDRERNLLVEADYFTDPTDKQRFFETRADIIATDQLVRANINDPGRVVQIKESAEYRTFRDSFTRVISDPEIVRPGTKTPVDYIEVEKLIERYPVGKVGASREKAYETVKQLQNDILDKMKTADPVGIARLRAANSKIDDYYKNASGEVKTKVALTAGMLAAGAIYLQTLYDAETKETGQSFENWAAEKAPHFFAALPAAAVVIVGLHMIAMAGPIGAAFVISADVGMGYEVLKHFSKNYITAYPNGKYVGVFSAIADMFTSLEKTTVFNIAHEYYSAVGKVASYIIDPITPKVEVFTGGTAGRLPDDATWMTWLAGQDQAELYGNANSNVLFHDGFGIVYGLGGNDILVGLSAKAIDKGQPVWPKESESPLAEDNLRLLLDGGEGRDWVIAIGGEKVITAGGLGRDWIFNRSNGGVIYGDVVNSNGNKVRDDAENTDNIWYSANTVVKDAKHHDFLKFYGLTLTGGNAEGGIAGLAVGGKVGAVAGLANFYASLDDNGKYDPARSVYFDHLFPWMTYAFRPNGNGGLDLYVTNQFDQLFSAVFGGSASDAYKQQQTLDAQGILKGWMKVENFDLVGSFVGYQQASLAGEGTFGMVFKAPNPITALMTLYEPLLGIYGVALAAQYGGNVMIDQAITLRVRPISHASRPSLRTRIMTAAA